MRILIVEDEAAIARNIAETLQAAGFVTSISGDGEDAWFKGATENYAAVIMDLGLPKLDGLSVIKRWRSEGLDFPVIVLSARGSWAERVDGIDSGADDYLAKPFQMQELMARLRALLRRSGGAAKSTLTVGPLLIDLKDRTVSVNGTAIALTPLEFRLVQYLAMQQGRVTTQTEIADALYDHDHNRDANAIEAVVSRLRRKLGNDLIRTRRGFGYYLQNPA
ncbi:response regulator transcription factor [Aestuariivirga litoralis]|uniref:response regulator transcription factor n=1 Tax=Aestuariivirga litoralis TaxID=2650924 RepID=UPI0018C6D8D3|nr:response regulator transcription factor [Aestuariivirga litoralis]MBG1231552.1 response regulator transcription factor [Aestuariivirga litoralis]